MTNVQSSHTDSDLATIDGRSHVSSFGHSPHEEENNPFNINNNNNNDNNDNSDIDGNNNSNNNAKSDPEGDAYRASLQNLWITPGWVLILFTACNFGVYYDRGATSPAVNYIAVDSSIAGQNTTLTDAQVGMINSVFVLGFITWAPLAIVLQAKLTSLNIFCIGIVCWIVAVLAGGLAQSYAMLLAGRAFVGIGEASYAGFSLTIIDNIAPPNKRSLWISIFYATIPLSTAAGIGVNGIISSSTFGDIPGWRAGFILETIPMFIILLFMLFLPREYNVRKDDRVEGGRTAYAEAQLETRRRQLHENEHTSAEEKQRALEQQKEKDDADEEVPFFTAIKALFTNVNYLMISAGYGIGYTFVLGALSFFAISMLTQSPMEVSTVEASLLMGGTTAVIGLVASAAGGIYVDKVGGSQGWEGVYRCCAFMAVSIAIAFPSGLFALFLENFPAFVVVFIWTCWWLFVITGPINCAALSVVDPKLRPYSVSFNILIIHALGDLPSTTIVGSIGDSFDGGCKDFDDDKDKCLAHNVTSGVGACRFFPPPMKNERARCVNNMELTIALRIAWVLLVLALFFWGAAALRIKRHRSVNGIPAPRDGEEGDGEGGTDSDVAAEAARAERRVPVASAPIEHQSLLSGEESR